MGRIADVASFFGDAQRAAILYDLLLPYADLCPTPHLGACRGSLSRPLGVLATLLSRYDEAERHFENALEMNARIRARIWVAHTQHDYARMLVARDEGGDREKAAALAAQALATAREVGMKPTRRPAPRTASASRTWRPSSRRRPGGPTPAAPRGCARSSRPPTGSASARKAVTSRIRESIDRIGQEHAALARHPENAIRTGTFCSYRPDRPLRWVI